MLKRPDAIDKKIKNIIDRKTLSHSMKSSLLDFIERSNVIYEKDVRHIG